jgi:hypothetical protein
MRLRDNLLMPSSNEHYQIIELSNYQNEYNG